MTENEVNAIKWMKCVKDDAVVTLDNIAKNESNVSPMLYAGRKEKAETIINGFEELEQYRAIGTVEEIREAAEKIAIAYELYELFDNQSIIKETMEKLRKMVDEFMEYREIGTVEECREVMERQKVKKPVKTENNGFRYTDSYICPNCRKGFTGTGIADFCYHCGQAIDWSDTD